MLCLVYSLSQKKLTNFINKIFLIPKPRHIYLHPIKEKFISVNILLTASRQWPIISCLSISSYFFFYIFETLFNIQQKHKVTISISLGLVWDREMKAIFSYP